MTRRTYLDANILIAAWQGSDPLGARALAVLDDPERQLMVCAYTATAKPEVIAEIREHFRRELDLELLLFAGGVERDNLAFEVHPVSRAEKLPRIDALLRGRLDGQGGGAAVVYCATRKHVEDTTAWLLDKDWPVAAFHAGLEAPRKRQVQDDFLAGRLAACVLLYAREDIEQQFRMGALLE